MICFKDTYYVHSFGCWSIYYDKCGSFRTITEYTGLQRSWCVTHCLIQIESTDIDMLVGTGSISYISYISVNPYDYISWAGPCLRNGCHVGILRYLQNPTFYITLQTNIVDSDQHLVATALALYPLFKSLQVLPFHYFQFKCIFAQNTSEPYGIYSFSLKIF